MSFTWTAKDPDEVLDYAHDWGPRLVVEGDAILDTVQGEAEVIVESGTVEVDLDRSSVTPEGLQTVWLQGGVIGDVRLTLRVQTLGGRTYDEAIKLKIKER